MNIPAEHCSAEKEKSEKLVPCSPAFQKIEEIMQPGLQDDVTFDTA